MLISVLKSFTLIVYFFQFHFIDIYNKTSNTDDMNCLDTRYKRKDTQIGKQNKNRGIITKQKTDLQYIWLSFIGITLYLL